ncbi:MAG: type II toxin-antitoxin system VapC family toxin [Bifidobacteriaceae bacterium]|nr:type II toxin-antitoxin system VapC family toxin [Bifidobacteriaceae bacterium]
MNVYFDTSAIVPILIAEPPSEACRQLWDDADQRISSPLAYVEVAAALAMAERQERLTAEDRSQAWAGFAAIWPDVHQVDLTAELLAQAADLARSQSLRAYDAVHCASALAVSDSELVAATGDTRLLAAWRDLDLATHDTNLQNEAESDG